MRGDAPAHAFYWTLAIRAGIITSVPFHHQRRIDPMSSLLVCPSGHQWNGAESGDVCPTCGAPANGRNGEDSCSFQGDTASFAVKKSEIADEGQTQTRT